MSKWSCSVIITQLNKLLKKNCVSLTVFDLTWCIYPTQASFTEPTSTHTPDLSEPKGPSTPDRSPFCQDNCLLKELVHRLVNDL